MSLIKNKSIFYVLLLFVIIFSIIILFNGTQRQNTLFRPLPSRAVLDLSRWDPVQGGLVTLSGGWEFYWKKLFSYDDLNKDKPEPDLMAEVPAVWNNYKLNGENLSGFGAATYRLRVRNHQKGQALAIRMPTVSAAYSLYINDRLIASNGKAGMDMQHYSPEYRPVMVEFTPPSGDFDIILHVANFSYARGGVWNPIFLVHQKLLLIMIKLSATRIYFLLAHSL